MRNGATAQRRNGATAQRRNGAFFMSPVCIALKADLFPSVHPLINHCLRRRMRARAAHMGLKLQHL